MRSTIKFGALLVLGILAVVATILGLTRQQASPPSLLASSQVVAQLNYGKVGFDQWRDSHTFLYAVGGDKNSQEAIYSYDFDSRTTRRLPTFPRPQRFDKSIGTYWDEVVTADDVGRTSPDGAWAIWCTGDTYEIASLQRSACFTVKTPVSREEHHIDYWPYYDRSWAAWMPSGDHWLEMRPDEKGQPWLLTHSLSGATLSKVAVGPAKQNGYIDEPYANRPALLGVTPSQHAILWDGGTGLFDVDLSTSPAKVAQHSIKPPAEGTLLDAILSPDGKRILWRSHIRARRNWLPMIKTYGTHILWMSDVDGGNMRELAEQSIDETEMTSADNSDYTFQSFRWLPDGKSISFVRDDKLYLMPVGK